MYVYGSQSKTLRAKGLSACQHLLQLSAMRSALLSALKKLHQPYDMHGVRGGVSIYSVSTGVYHCCITCQPHLFSLRVVYEDSSSKFLPRPRQQSIPAFFPRAHGLGNDRIPDSLAYHCHVIWMYPMGICSIDAAIKAAHVRVPFVQPMCGYQVRMNVRGRGNELKERP